MSQKIITADIIIIGAGIAGLWLHNRLNTLGYHTLLLENKTIGNAQTLSSQGIIHGGAKYALNGILSKATHAIGDMPTRWKDCLTGQGDIDLTNVNILTSHQLLWSQQQLSSKITSFFASKALSSRMTPIATSHHPSPFRDPNFKGTLYQLDEPVLDIPSVLTAISAPWSQRILQIPNAHTLNWQQQGDTINTLHINEHLTLKAQQFVLTAGEGNQTLIESLGIKSPQMQRRPLKMMLCKAKDNNTSLPPLYGHCLGTGSKPIATITSHRNQAGNIVWYIGGHLSEQGIDKPHHQLQNEANTLLTDIMPWLKLPELEWASHAVNRAEPKQNKLSRPDTSFIETHNNIHIAWPTKLALAPDLTDKIIKVLKNQTLTANTHPNPTTLPPAEIGTPLWDKAFK